MRQSLKLVSAAALYCVTTANVYAEEAVNYNESTLTGDWAGNRTRLANAGVTVDAVYKFDVMGNASGGIKQGVDALDNLDVVLNFDGEKLFGSKGTTALVHFLNNNGGKPDASLVGSAQGIDNIEVPRATAKLYQAWIQQSFWDDKVSVLAGLYDLNSEFYVNNAAGLFIHSAYGIGTDIAQSGNNGPSIFPFTALTARVKVQPTPNFYVQAALADGTAGDPNNARGTQIELNSRDGGLWIAEAGYLPRGDASGDKLALGGWYYTNRFPDQVSLDASGNPVQRHSNGFYMLGEKQIYQETGSETKGLSVFARLGFANQDVNQFNYAYTAGVVYTGLIPKRDEGRLGLGVAGAHNGGKYKYATVSGGGSANTSETEFELTYSDNITPWMSIQPDVQYVVNPGTDPALENALVFGARLAIAF